MNCFDIGAEEKTGLLCASVIVDSKASKLSNLIC